jgi:hypothetical protein
MKLMKRSEILGLVLACGAVPAYSQQTSIYATGLKNPSKVIAAANGSLLVTEVDTTPNSGRVSLVDGAGRVQALITGLPSGAASPDGTLDGPNGLALAGRVLFVANGEGDTHVAGPTPGTIVPNPAGRSSPIFTSILKVTFNAEPDRITAPFALSRANQDTLADGKAVRLENGAGDQAVFELLADFRDNVPDARTIYRNSHPYGITLHPSYPEWLFVADAGMNTVWQVNIENGRASTLVRFPAIPTGIPSRPAAEAVPNSVHAYGDQLLVTQLSGVPFVPGTSQVSLVDIGTGKIEPFIYGLSSAMDIVWQERSGTTPIFYVLEFSAGLAQSPPLAGRLKRYETAEGQVLAGTLRTPTSMVLDSNGRALYITDRSGGTIVKVDLP